MSKFPFLQYISSQKLIYQSFGQPSNKINSSSCHMLNHKIRYGWGVELHKLLENFFIHNPGIVLHDIEDYIFRCEIFKLLSDSMRFWVKLKHIRKTRPTKSLFKIDIILPQTLLQELNILHRLLVDVRQVWVPCFRGQNYYPIFNKRIIKNDWMSKPCTRSNYPSNFLSIYSFIVKLNKFTLLHNEQSIRCCLKIIDEQKLWHIQFSCQ